jgi:hypothetical protein
VRALPWDALKVIRAKKRCFAVVSVILRPHLRLLLLLWLLIRSNLGRWLSGLPDAQRRGRAIVSCIDIRVNLTRKIRALGDAVRKGLRGIIWRSQGRCLPRCAYRFPGDGRTAGLPVCGWRLRRAVLVTAAIVFTQFHDEAKTRQNGMKARAADWVPAADGRQPAAARSRKRQTGTDVCGVKTEWKGWNVGEKNCLGLKVHGQSQPR